MQTHHTPIAAALLLTLVLVSTTRAGLDDLWITEVVPSTGEVEVTNVGDESYTTTGDLPFCYRFRYSPVIPSNTMFAAGESKVFTLNFANSADTDLWLYRDRSFGVGTSIITGLKWGPAGNVGRTGAASAAGRWTGTNVFVPAPANGMALQLTGADQFSDASWSEGVPDLGNYSPPVEIQPLRTTSVALDSGMLVFSWSGGEPPYLVESSADLGNWIDEAVTGELSHSLDAGALGCRRFLRVSQAPIPDETAMFRITFTSNWSPDDFVTVPGGDHFTGLIGMTHDDSVALWRSGELATPGIESMAETGSKTTLSAEIDVFTSGDKGGGVKLSGGGTGSAGTQTTLDFEASVAHPLVSIVSMIAPSPDWFVGTQSQSLLGTDGDWISSLSVDLFAYDSGSDDGTDFTSSNAESTPHVPIFPISDTTPFALKPGVTEPQPLATMVIERLP